MVPPVQKSSVVKGAEDSTSVQSNVSSEKANVIYTEDITGLQSNESIVKNDLGALEAGQAPEARNKITFGFFMTMLGFSMIFVASEIIPLFLITLFTRIVYSLHGSAYLAWTAVSQFIAIAAIAPFVGTLSDLLGRRKVILTGLACTVIAMIVIGTAQDIAGLIAGQVVAGVGVGIQLLTTIAAATELVPTSKRGSTIGYIVCGIIPFGGASLYGQYLAAYSWRWVAVLAGIWAVIAFIVTAVFYHPPPRVNSEGLSKREIIRRIDFVGSFLSLAAIILFMIGLNWGGQSYPWKSAEVIATILASGIVMIIFFIWEKYGTKYPMFPMALTQSGRPFIAVSILAFTSGINFVPVVAFWTMQLYTVYYASFHDAGVYLLPIGFCITGGAAMSAVLMSVFSKRVPVILMLFCIMQTTGLGCMAAISSEDVRTAWAPMVLGLIGVGGVLLPSQVVFSIITPDELLGTGVALSIVIRMIGQVVGLSMFFNLFMRQIQQNVVKYLAGPAMQVGFNSVASIELLVPTLMAGPLSSSAYLFPQLDSPEKIQTIVTAGHELFKHCIPPLYLISIPFGVAAVVSAFFLRDINRYMDNHVAVLL